MRISNLVSTTRHLNQQIADLAIRYHKEPERQIPESEIEQILQTLEAAVTKTEQLCKKRGGSPSDLPTPSYRAYQWMKFLSRRKWLLTHIYAVKEFYSLLGKILPMQMIRNLSNTIQIDCYHSSYLFRNRQKERKIFLEINEGFISAPVDIKRTILEAALKRRTSKRLKTIREYAASQNYAAVHTHLQANTGSNKLSALGRYFDLIEIFDSINRQYFNEELEQARLVWSARRSTRRLGYYHPDSDTITISKRLDSSDIPQYLVEYVMYHEMLHKKLGLKEVNGRKYAHTRQFKEAEKRFAHYREAEKAIKKLNQP
jgi:hypothetical protein